MGTGSFWGV